MNRSLKYHHRSWGVQSGTLVVVVGMIGVSKPVCAQSSFQVVGDVTPFDFSINGTNINSTTGANLSGYLSTKNNNTNTLTVGWNPPVQGSYIELKYTGTTPFNLGGASVTTGDYLHVYAISGVYLTTSASSIAASSSGSTLTNWTNTTVNSGWGFSAQSSSINGTSFSDAGYSTNSTNFLGYTNTGSVDGKSFSGAAKYGTFSFNKLNLGNATAAYLGLDIYAQVFNTTDTAELSAAATGHVSINSFAPGSVTPEGSSLALIAAGLLPLAWQGRRILKRKTSTQ